MTTRQKKFVDEFIICGNGAEAARRSGYSSRTAKNIAAQLLSNPEIRAAINEQLEQARTANVARQAELLDFLSRVVRGEVADEIAMSRLVGKGCATIEKINVRADVKSRIRACELLLKIHGAFRDVQQEDSGTERYIEALEKICREESA